MAGDLIISISGLRGVVGQNFSAPVACDYACAFGSFLKQKYTGKKDHPRVCIGRDSRPSGQMISSAVSAGLASVGVDCIDIGIISTPAVGIMLRLLGCAGGVIVTASHNPVEFNGIKLLLENGIAPPPSSADKIKKLFIKKDFVFTSSVDCGKLSFNPDAAKVHVDKVLQLVDAKKISSKKYKVVLDVVNGAGGTEMKLLLSKLGCKTVAINDEPNGLFAHNPEPLAANLSALCEAVKVHKAHIGFAIDPDADRIAVVNENGDYIGEEFTLALAAKFVLTKNKGPVATNLSTSRMIDDIAAQAGVKVFRTPVGEANVAAAMLEHNCVLAGEGNGGVIDPRTGPVRDSLVGAALILQFLAESGKTIGALVRGIRPYSMLKTKFNIQKGTFDKIIEKAKKIFIDAKVNTSDGLRLDFDAGWLHIRESNTEPVVRVIAEASDPQTAQKYLDTIRNIIENKW